jgi:hypothetical protein
MAAMNPKLFWLITAILLALAHRAEAQQSKKSLQTIGFVQGGATPISLVDAFRKGLQELGYIEGENIRIEY